MEKFSPIDTARSFNHDRMVSVFLTAFVSLYWSTVQETKDAKPSSRTYLQYLRDKASGRSDALERELLEAEVRIKKAKADIAEQEAKEFQGWPV